MTAARSSIVLRKGNHRLHGHAKSIRELAQDAQAWVAYASLNLGDESAVYVGIKRKGLLGKPKLSAPSLDARC